MQRLVDTPWVAAFLGVPARTLDQWAHLGTGPAYVRVGRHRRYRQEDVESWVASRVRGGAA